MASIFFLKTAKPYLLKTFIANFISMVNIDCDFHTQAWQGIELLSSLLYLLANTIHMTPLENVFLTLMYIFSQEINSHLVFCKEPYIIHSVAV